MKENWTLRIGALVLMFTLASACLVGGTISRYTSTVTGSDSVEVALWKFTIDTNDNVPTVNTFTFGLFDEINDTNGGGAETDVAADLIAPGTAGHFDILMQNTGEVNARYELILSSVVNNDNIPVKFSINGTDWLSPDNGVVVFTGQYGRTGILTMGAERATTVTVYWRWPFVGDDSVDTLLGVDGTATIDVTAQITLTQVD